VAAAEEIVDQAEPVRDLRAFTALVERAGNELPEGSSALLHQVLRVLGEWRPVGEMPPGPS